MSPDESTPESDLRKRSGRLVVDENVPTVRDVARFIRAHWIAIFGGTAVGGSVVALYLVVLAPDQYRASALLSPIPLSAATLEGQELSLEGYRDLLESSAVVSLAQRRLSEQGLLEMGEPLRLGANLESRVFHAPRRGSGSSAQILEARALDEDPEIAAEIANSWTRGLVEKSQELTFGLPEDSLQKLEKQIQQAEEEISELEEKRTELMKTRRRTLEAARDRLDRKLAQSAERWDQKEAESLEETHELLHAFHVESRQLFDSLVSQYAGAAEHSDDHTDIAPPPTAQKRAALQPLLVELAVLRSRLAQAPPYLPLEAAERPQASGHDNESRPGIRTGSTSRGGTIDTVGPTGLHDELTLRIGSLEREIETLAAREGKWTSEIRRDLDRLQRQRASELAVLVEARSVDWRKLQRQQQLTLDQMRRRRSWELQLLKDAADADARPVESALRSAKARAKDLSKRYDHLELALTDREWGRIQIISPATPPRAPLRKQLVGPVILGLLTGGLLGLGSAALLHSETGG